MSSLSHEFSNFIRSSRSLDQRAIAFIDPNIAGWKDLVQQVAPEIRVIVIDSLTNGVSAITHTLRSSYCQEVHLICSGTPGCLYLGRSELSRNTLIQHESKLQQWFSHLDSTHSPQLYLHGNNAAMGDVGAEFVERLNLITGAAIAASPKLYSSKVFG